MKHLLVMRLSAFGDVAMSVPVVREFLEQNPEVHITFVSHFALAPCSSPWSGWSFSRLISGSSTKALKDFAAFTGK